MIGDHIIKGCLAFDVQKGPHCGCAGCSFWCFLAPKSLTLQPDCLLRVGLIVRALGKGGLSDHTSLCTISVHVPVGLLHPQQFLTFLPISITDQPKKRSLLKIRSQSREKRSSYSSPESHVDLFGHLERLQVQKGTQVCRMWGLAGLAALCTVLLSNGLSIRELGLWTSKQYLDTRYYCLWSTQ